MTKMEYILFAKEPVVSKSDKAVKQDVQSVFNSACNDTFNVMIKRTEVELRLSLKKREIDNTDGKAYYLTLVSNAKTKQKSVDALEDAHFRILRNAEFRKKYHIVLLCDDVSSYYCVKAYPIFHEYEKQIRRLIYKYLTMSWGALWVDKTITEELKKQLKERTKGKSSEQLIAQMLHEMDMSQLELYLFEPKRDMSTADVIDIKLSNENIENLTKDEIVSIIQSSRPHSLWDRYFSAHIEIEDLQTKMTIIRDNRNKVAHCKQFYYDDFNVSMKILKKDGLIDKLRVAIEKLETKELSLITLQDVAQGLADFGKLAAMATITLSPALLQMANFMQVIHKQVSTAAVNTLITTLAERTRATERIICNSLIESMAQQAQVAGNSMRNNLAESLAKQAHIAERLMQMPWMNTIQKIEQNNHLYNSSAIDAISRGIDIQDYHDNFYTMNCFDDKSHMDDEDLSEVADDEKSNSKQDGNNDA